MFYIINYFAGPGAGKSTSATGLFSELKKLKDTEDFLKDFQIELVTEFAKDKVYELNPECLDNQFLTSAQQHHRLWRVMNYWLKNGITDGIIVTDSPLLLGVIYNDKSSFAANHLNHLLLSEFTQMQDFEYPGIKNINIFINRDKKYDKLGRLQTENEANEIDDRIYEVLEYFEIPFEETYSSTSIEDSLKIIKQSIN